MKRKNIVRLNLEFPPQIYQQMLVVQKRTNAASLTEVMRRSVALYDLLTERIEAGDEINLVHRDGTTQTLRIL